MKNISKLSIFLALFALPATAMAQDMDEDGMEEAGMVEEGMEEAGAEEAGAEEAGTTEAAETAVSTGYPLSENLRPLTLPAGTIELGGDLSHLSLSISGGAGISVSATSTALFFSGAYAVDDKIEVGASTGFQLDPDAELSKTLNLRAHYLVHDTEKLDVAAGVTLPLNFNDGADLVSSFGIDANTRFLVNDQISVIGGNNIMNIGIDPSAIDVNLNVGAAFQATEPLSVYLTTQLASIAVSGDGNETSTLGDVIPLTIGALFAVSEQLDVRGALTLPSVEDAADIYVINVGANFRL